MFRKKDALKNLAKFTGKTLCQSLFLNKVAGSKETLAQVFPFEYCKISKNTLFYRTPRVAASGKIRTIFLKSAKFQFQLFLATLDIMGLHYIVTK